MRLSASGGYNITGGSGADTFYGGTGQDTFLISAAGHQTSDTYDGGANTDTLQLSSGTFNFSNNSSIINIEAIKTNEQVAH